MQYSQICRWKGRMTEVRVWSREVGTAVWMMAGWRVTVEA